MQMTGTMVSNPPYGQRLQSDQLDEIHRVLADIYLRNNISGACISGYQAAQRYFDADHFKYTDLSHGSQEVTLFQYRVHDHKITMNQQ